MADNEQDQGALPQPAIVEEIHAMPDPILQAIAHTVARHDSFEIDLTLHVSGAIISGTVVSASRFFTEMSEWLTAGGHEDFAETFASPIAGMLRVETSDDEQDDMPTAMFIHLRAARIFTSDFSSQLPATLWRGRLSHVSAWSVGSFGFGK